MATSLPHTYKSISYEGRYLTLKIEEVSKDHAKNRSKIKWTVTTVGGAVQYYDTYCSVSINGTQVANSGWILETNNNWNNWGNNVAKKGWQGSGTTDWIKHGNDGKKNVTVSWTVGIFNWTTVTGTDTVALSQLDDDPPAVCEQGDIAAINAYARTATASVTASSGCTMYWRWKVGSGNWTSWSNTNIQLQVDTGASATYHRPLSGLSYDTTYQFQFKAVKNTNGKSKESNIRSFSIPGASTLNFANDIIVGDNISFTFNAKSKSSYYTHKIGLSVPGWTATLGAISTSGQNITVGAAIGDNTLTAAIQALMQNRLTAVATTASLYTYQTGTGQVGSHSSKTLTIRVDQNTSKPSLVADYRSTNEEAKLIQVDVDSLYITATATPKYGATLRSLTAKIGSRSIDLTNGSETSWGIVTQAQIANGTVLTVTAEDSRGLKTSQEFALNIKVEHPQTLLKAEDFQRWYSILDEIYSGKYPNGNYYIGGSAKNFEVIPVEQGDKATLTPIISNTKGICGAVDALQYAEDATTHQLFFYADPTVKAAIDNIIALEDWVTVGNNNILRLSGNTIVSRGNTESTITWDAANNEIDFTNGTNTNFEVVYDITDNPRIIPDDYTGEDYSGYINVTRSGDTLTFVPDSPTWISSYVTVYFSNQSDHKQQLSTLDLRPGGTYKINGIAALQQYSTGVYYYLNFYDSAGNSVGSTISVSLSDGATFTIPDNAYNVTALIAFYNYNTYSTFTYTPSVEIVELPNISGTLQIAGTSEQYNQPTKIVKELKETLDTNMDIINQVVVIDICANDLVVTYPTAVGVNTLIYSTWDQLVANQTNSACPLYSVGGQASHWKIEGNQVQYVTNPLSSSGTPLYRYSDSNPSRVPVLKTDTPVRGYHYDTAASN